MDINKQLLEQTLSSMQDIFRDVLENDSIVLKYETNSSHIPEWDSLNHIALVVSIEKHFNVRFTAKEIQDFKNVGEMGEGIIRKMQKA